MSKNQPLKLTHEQTQYLQKGLDQLVENVIIRWGADPANTRLEMAMICGRYAVNAGVLDAHLVPEETDDQAATDTHSSSPGEDRGTPAQPGHGGEGEAARRPRTGRSI